MQEIPTKYPPKKRNTKKEQNQGIGFPHQVKIKTQNPTKKSKVNQNPSQPIWMMIKTAIISWTQKK